MDLDLCAVVKREDAGNQDTRKKNPLFFGYYRRYALWRRVRRYLQELMDKGFADVTIRELFMMASPL